MSRSNFAQLRGRLYPAGVNAYYRCPQKFFLRHIAKREVPHVFKAHLAFGGATHKVLAHQLSARMNGTDPGNPADLARDYLTRESRRSPDQHAFVSKYIEQVADHVDRGLRSIPDECQILAVERTFSHRLRTPGLEEDISLCARIDVVFRFPDGTVEHVDFKTGKQTSDLFQNFISRVTVASELAVDRERLRTSNVATSTGAHVLVNSDPDANASVWTSIREVLEQVAVDQEWRARPEPAICGLCEYNAICKYADLGTDGVDRAYDS